MSTAHTLDGYRQLVTWGRYYWPYFLILGSALFGIPELIALFTNNANTLSDYARYELNVAPHITVHTLAWYVSLCAWVLFFVVITAHIWWNWG